MLGMDECISKPQNVMLVVWIPIGIEHLQNRHFHHTLLVVCWLVLDDLDSHNLVRLHILALDDLSKGTLAEDVQDEVAIAVFIAQPVIDVQDVVAVLIVVAIVIHWLARLCQDPPRIKGQLIDERRIDQMIGVMKVRGHCLERTDKASRWIRSSCFRRCCWVYLWS